MAGLQLQQFTVQKTAQEHSLQNKETILARAKHLGIPTVISTLRRYAICWTV